MIINPFLYNIELWKNGIKTDDISNVLSLSVKKEQNSIGTLIFSVYVEPDFYYKFSYNTIVVMYRRSMVYGVAPYIEFIGHVVDIDPIEDDNLAPTATVICYDFKELLSRRKILYYQSSPYAIKTGNAETVIKSYVYENIGGGANNRVRFANGIINKFYVEKSSDYGEHLDGEDKSGQDLLTVVKDLCDTSKLKFDVIGDVDGSFLFITKQDRIGRNLSVSNLREEGINMFGYMPVRFNFGIGNISKVTRKILNTNKLSTVTAFGQGTDEDREIYTIYNDGMTGLYVREDVVNANNDDNEGLIYVASRRFNNPPVESYETNIIQIPGFIYGYDYFLGDLITFEYQSVMKHLVIDAVELSIESDGSESVSITLKEEL